jgi:putative transposase
LDLALFVNRQHDGRPPDSAVLWSLMMASSRRRSAGVFLGFLKLIEANVPADLDAHLVVDNYAAHKHPKVRAWLAARPRFHIHYTPTYASWLNQVERWFALITERQIRRASFVSAKDLIEKIGAFVETYNAKARPFIWTATSDVILEKVGRLCKVICGTGH